jgi:hypothetical protein
MTQLCYCHVCVMEHLVRLSEREREREKNGCSIYYKQIIKIHLDCYIHKAASILQTGVRLSDDQTV